MWRNVHRARTLGHRRLGGTTIQYIIVHLIALKESVQSMWKMYSPHANIPPGLNSLQHQLMSKIPLKHPQLQVLTSHRLTLVWVKLIIIHPGAKFFSISEPMKPENWRKKSQHDTIVRNMLGYNCRYSLSKREIGKKKGMTNPNKFKNPTGKTLTWKQFINFWNENVHPWNEIVYKFSRKYT